MRAFGSLTLLWILSILWSSKIASGQGNRMIDAFKGDGPSPQDDQLPSQNIPLSSSTKPSSSFSSGSSRPLSSPSIFAPSAISLDQGSILSPSIPSSTFSSSPTIEANPSSSQHDETDAQPTNTHEIQIETRISTSLPTDSTASSRNEPTASRYTGKVPSSTTQPQHADGKSSTLQSTSPFPLEPTIADGVDSNTKFLPGSIHAIGIVVGKNTVPGTWATNTPTPTGSKPPKQLVGAPLSGSALSWAMDPRCTASWSSREVEGNGTVLETRTQTITVVLTSSTTTSIGGGTTITGPTSTVVERTASAEILRQNQCCGDCWIRYPTVSVYYWPPQGGYTNLWCLPYISGRTDMPKPEETGGVQSKSINPDFPVLDKDKRKRDLDVKLAQEAAFRHQRGQLPLEIPIIQGDGDAKKGVSATITSPPSLHTHNPQRYRDANFRVLHPRDFIKIRQESPDPAEPIPGEGDDTQSHLPAPQVGFDPISLGPGATAKGPGGITFIWPSVYVEFHTVMASDACRQIGQQYTSTMFSYAPDELSSIDGVEDKTLPFNFADLPCPPSTFVGPNMFAGNARKQIERARTYRPVILGPEKRLKDLDPEWSTCSLINVGNGYDPPRALTPEGMLVPTQGVQSMKIPDDVVQPRPPGDKAVPANALLAPLPEETTAPDDPGQQLQVDPQVDPQVDTQIDPALPPLPLSINDPVDPEDSIPQQNPQTQPKSDPQSDLQTNSQPDLQQDSQPNRRPNAQPRPPAPAQAQPQPQLPAQPPAQAHVQAQVDPGQPPSPPKAPAPAANPAAPAPGPQPAILKQDAPVIHKGQTIEPNAPPVTIENKPVQVSGGSIHVGSSAAPVPQQVLQKGDPVVAGGVTMTPAPQIAPDALPPNAATVGGLTFSAGDPPKPAQPQAQAAVTAGGMTFQPVNTVQAQAKPGQPGSPPDSGEKPTMINGQAYTPVAKANNPAIPGNPKNPPAPPVNLDNVKGEVAIPPGAPVVRGGTTFAPVVGGVPTPPLQIGSVAGKPIVGNANQAVVDGKTIRAGGPAVNIKGTPVALGDQGLVIGSSTISIPGSRKPDAGNLEPAGPGAFAINGQTISPNAPAITVSGTRISLGPTGLIVGSSTIAITPPASLPSNSNPNPRIYSISGTGVTENGPPITVAGTRISLNSNGVIIGDKSIALPTSSVLTVGSETFTPNPSGFLIAGTSLTPGGPGATISGTAISLDRASSLIIGSTTIALPVPLTTAPSATGGQQQGQAFSVGGHIFTPLPLAGAGAGAGQFSALAIDGSAILPGAASTTISGTAYSLDESGQHIVIGHSTYSIAGMGGSANDRGSGSGSPSLTAGGIPFRPLGTSAVELPGGGTLVMGGETTLQGGTRVSLGTEGLVVGSETVGFVPGETTEAATTATGKGTVVGGNSEGRGDGVGVAETGRVGGVGGEPGIQEEGGAGGRLEPTLWTWQWAVVGGAVMLVGGL